MSELRLVQPTEDQEIEQIIQEQYRRACEIIIAWRRQRQATSDADPTPEPGQFQEEVTELPRAA